MDAQSPLKSSNTEFNLTSPMGTDADKKRRSSNRSIKRKRFDDEIVEYSLGLPQAQLNRVGRARTESKTYLNTNYIIESPTATVTNVISPPPPPTPVALQPPLPPVPVTTSSSIISIAIASPSSTIPAVTSVTTASTPPIQSSGKPQNIAALAATSLLQQVNTPPAITTGSNVQPQLPINNSAATPSTPINSSSSVPATGAAAALASTNVATVTEKRRLLKGNKKPKKNRPGSHQIATKDLGRWKPIDDLALIIGVQQTNDLKMVHRGVKFSCKFTIAEIQSRWYSLLYEEPISRIAVAAMRNLHPEQVEMVHSKALFTVQEEELLGTVKSNENPTLETFQELLDANVLVFYPSRTAKSLSNHWHLMKQYSLLPDQTISTYTRGEPLLSFSDAEELLNDAELAEMKDETFELELALADRKCKKEIRHLENEITRWSVLVDSLPGIGFAAEFDNQTLAVLRGRLVRFLMRSREITFGRTTKDQVVDVDLTLEGPAGKISRKQGTIKLRSNGDFFMSNEGKRPIYIDGMPILTSSKGRLNNNCVIEVAGLRFIFLVNHELVNAIRQESAKMNGPLN